MNETIPEKGVILFILDLLNIQIVKSSENTIIIVCYIHI
jgi:hypothetical protein